MTTSNAPEPKLEALRAHGTFHTRSKDVEDPLFQGSEFFDPRDLVQVKYEMLRRVKVDEEPIAATAAAFGFSRPSFYQARAAFERQGLAGLIPQKRGPRGAHKLTDEIAHFLEATLARDRSLRPPALADLVHEEYGVRLHPRTIERRLRGQEKKLLPRGAHGARDDEGGNHSV